MTKIKDYADTTVGFCDPVNGIVEIKGVHGTFGSVCLQVGQDYRIVNPDTRRLFNPSNISNTAVLPSA